jgi:hypothetical protein
MPPPTMATRSRSTLMDSYFETISRCFVNASHAARCIACHGVRSHAVPVALVGECSIPVV